MCMMVMCERSRRVASFRGLLQREQAHRHHTRLHKPVENGADSPCDRVRWCEQCVRSAAHRAGCTVPLYTLYCSGVHARKLMYRLTCITISRTVSGLHPRLKYTVRLYADPVWRPRRIPRRRRSRVPRREEMRHARSGIALCRAARRTVDRSRVKTSEYAVLYGSRLVHLARLASPDAARPALYRARTVRAARTVSSMMYVSYPIGFFNVLRCNLYRRAHVTHEDER